MALPLGKGQGKKYIQTCRTTIIQNIGRKTPWKNEQNTSHNGLYPRQTQTRQKQNQQGYLTLYHYYARTYKTPILIHLRKPSQHSFTTNRCTLQTKVTTSTNIISSIINHPSQTDHFDIRKVYSEFTRNQENLERSDNFSFFFSYFCEHGRLKMLYCPTFISMHCKYFLF